MTKPCTIQIDKIYKLNNKGKKTGNPKDIRQSIYACELYNATKLSKGLVKAKLYRGKDGKIVTSMDPGSYKARQDNFKDLVKYNFFDEPSRTHSWPAKKRDMEVTIAFQYLEKYAMTTYGAHMIAMILKDSNKKDTFDNFKVKLPPA